MTNRIRPLGKSDLDAYVGIMAGAYPGLNINSDADRKRMVEHLAATFEDPSSEIYGLYRNRELLAGMILYDFSMNVRGTFVPAGGLGSLAVDLLSRKQKLGKELVAFYLRHFLERGIPLALLYPFRTDFYGRMGFGYGTKMNRYVFRPATLRQQPSSARHVEYLSVTDANQVLECYDRYATGVHGMILGSKQGVEKMLANPSIRTVGYVEEGRISGYLSFDFENQGQFLQNDLRIKQLIYEDAQALHGLLAFLRTLADQCERIVVNTQDETFHHLLDDPRNRSDRLLPSVFHESNTQGVGLMYRALDLPGLFSSTQVIRYGEGRLALRISVADSFLPANNGSVQIQFNDGRASVATSGESQAEIRLDISDFSSMYMGAISFSRLFEYGLAQINDGQYVDLVSRLFATDDKPVCMTTF